MRKHFLISCLLAGSIGGWAQHAMAQSNTKEVVVTGKIDNLPNDTVIRLFDVYMRTQDSAVIKDHSFTIRQKMSRDGSIYILMAGTQAPTEDNGTLLYLEGGAIKISGAAFKNASYTGPTWVKEWQEVMALTDPHVGLNKQFADIEAKYHDAKNIGDDDAVAVYEKQGAAIQEQQRKEFREWIGQHSNSGTTGYLITTYFKNDKDRDELYAAAGDHARECRLLARMKDPQVRMEEPMGLDVHTSDETGAAAVNIPGRPAAGAVAPGFTLPDVNGKMVSLSDFKGKYVYIDFWAGWCVPCMANMPAMKTSYGKYKDKNFVMLGVSLDVKREGWVKAIAKSQQDWIELSDLKGNASPVVAAYGISAIPAGVLIGPDGKIVGYLAGAALDKKLEELLK